MPAPQQSAMQIYNPFVPPSTQTKVMAAQQQAALAQALIQQGNQPLDTNNRQIGGVGYAISPMEGLAKALQSAVGFYGQNEANKALADALTSQFGGQQPADTTGTDQPNQQVPATNPNVGVATPVYDQFSPGASLNPAGIDPRMAMYAAQQDFPGYLEKAVLPFRTPTEQQKNLGVGTPAMANYQQTISDPLTQGVINGIEGYYPASRLRAASAGSMPQDASAALPKYNIPPISGMQVTNDGIMLNAPPPSAFAGGPVDNAAMDAAQGAIGSPNNAAPAYGKVVLSPQQQAMLDVRKEAAGSGAKDDFGQAQKIINAGNDADTILRINDTVRALQNGSYFDGQTGNIRADVANTLASLGMANTNLSSAAARTEAIDALLKRSFFMSAGLAQEQGEGSGGMQIRNLPEFQTKMAQAGTLDMLPGARDIALRFSDYQARKVANNRDALNEFYGAGNPYLTHDYLTMAARKNANLPSPVTEDDLARLLATPAGGAPAQTNQRAITKTLNGVTYTKVGGKWYQQ